MQFRQFWVFLFMGMTLLNLGMAQQEMTRGEMIAHIVCDGDTSQMYSAYWPEKTDSLCPVLFIFEPAARYQLAISTFQEAADHFGYLLIVSESAKNGPWPPILQAMDALETDVPKRFPIDPKRWYATGFSGGSRMAFAMGMRSHKLAGVMGCGAGFDPQYPPNESITFDYVGMIGRKDMNYLEMEEVQQKLNQYPQIAHTLLFFDKGHQWPPKTEIYDAFLWLEGRAKVKKRGKASLDKLLQAYEKRVERAKQDEHQLEASHLTQDLKEIYRWSLGEEILLAEPEGEEWEKVLAESEAAKEGERARMKIFAEAMGLIEQSIYRGDSIQKESVWWKARLKEESKYQSEGNSFVRESSFRVLDYLWRSAYVAYRGHWQQENWTMAGKYLTIWEMAQPESPWAVYHQARLAMQEGQKRKAIKELEKAVENGLPQIEILEQEPLFDSIRDHKKYIELRAQLISE